MARDFTVEPPASEAGDPGAAMERARVVQMPAREEPALEAMSLRDSTFAKIATKPVLKRQDKILRADADEENEIDILPTGEVYMSHVHVRRRMNEAFGPMGWALRPLSNPMQEGSTLVREFALIALGRVVATAFGSTKYYPLTKSGDPNPRADKADAAEAAKSNALTRCSKDLGIGSECWDRRWCRAWKNKYAVHVWCVERGRGRDRDTTETVDYWRRLDAEPLKNEIGPVEDSPNQAAWRKQSEAWIAMMKQEAEKTKAATAKLRAARVDLIQARRDQEAAKKETAAPASAPAVQAQPKPQPASAPAPAPPVSEKDSKPAGNQQGSRPATVHAPNAVNSADRPFLIREIKKPKTDRSPHAIVMMDGRTFWTFSSRVVADMQKHWAARDKIKIEHETHTAGDAKFNHVTEWTVIGTGEQRR